MLWVGDSNTKVLYAYNITKQTSTTGDEYINALKYNDLLNITITGRTALSDFVGRGDEMYVANNFTRNIDVYDISTGNETREQRITQTMMGGIANIYGIALNERHVYINDGTGALRALSLNKIDNKEDNVRDPAFDITTGIRGVGGLSYYNEIVYLLESETSGNTMIYAYDTKTLQRVSATDYRKGFQAFTNSSYAAFTSEPPDGIHVTGVEFILTRRETVSGSHRFNTYSYMKPRVAKIEATRGTNSKLTLKLTDTGRGYSTTPEVTIGLPASRYIEAVVIDHEDSESTNWSLEDSAGWFPQAWTRSKGYPTVFEFYQSRLIAAATKTLPTHVFGSVVGNPYSFREGVNADDSYSFNVSEDVIDQILALKLKGPLLVFTATGIKTLVQSITQSGTRVNIASRNEEGIAPNLDPVDYRENFLYIDNTGTNLFLGRFSDELKDYRVTTVSYTHLTLPTTPYV